MIDYPDILPLIALYAETHYRFRYFPFSRYYRREPEVIFDAPYRLEPGQTMPVTLIVKDAHRFPTIVAAEREVAEAGGSTVDQRRLPPTNVQPVFRRHQPG